MIALERMIKLQAAMTPGPYTLERKEHNDGTASLRVSGSSWRGFACIFIGLEYNDIDSPEGTANATAIAMLPDLIASHIEALRVIETLVSLNAKYAFFGSEIYQDRIDRAWHDTRDFLAKHAVYAPNATSQEAINEIEHGGLKKFDSVDALFTDLDREK